MDTVRALLHAKSLVNAGIMFFAGYGVSALLHLPARVAIPVAMGAIIANQLGLHQSAPGE